MLLFPPFHFKRPGVSIHRGYHFILALPRNIDMTINISMLSVQYLFIITIGGIIFYIFKNNQRSIKSNTKNRKVKKDNNKQKEKVSGS